MRNVRVSALSNSRRAVADADGDAGHDLVRLATGSMHGKTSMGTVIAFILLLRELYFPVNRISEINTVLHNSLAAIDRVFEFFDSEPDVEDPPNACAFRASKAACTSRTSPSAISRGARCCTTRADHPPGRGAGAGRAVGRRQVEPRPAGAALLRSRGGRVLLDGHDLRTLSLRRAARAGRHGVAGDAALLGHGPRQHPLRAPRRQPSRGARGGRGGARARVRHRRCRRATTRCSASAAASCRAGRSSASPSRARFSPTRASSSSTRRPARSTASPRR